MKYLSASFACLAFGALYAVTGRLGDVNVWLAASIILSSLAREKIK